MEDGKHEECSEDHRKPDSSQFVIVDDAVSQCNEGGINGTRLPSHPGTGQDLLGMTNILYPIVMDDSGPDDKKQA
jgi:hypothetical protein